MIVDCRRLPLFVVFTGALYAQQGHFTVDVKPTAAEQLKYANLLEQDVITHQRQTPQHLEAIAKAAAALDVVVAKWPDQSDDVGRACADKAHLFVNEQLYPDATAVCTSVRGLEKTSYGAMLHRLKGSAFLRMQHYDDAAREFDAAESHPKSQELSFVERAALYHEISWLNEKQARFAQASTYERRAARVEGERPTLRADAYLKSLELNIAGSNENEARADLRDFDRAIVDAWRDSPAPGEVTHLKSLEDASRKWHKKLGA